MSQRDDDWFSLDDAEGMDDTVDLEGLFDDVTEPEGAFDLEDVFATSEDEQSVGAGIDEAFAPPKPKPAAAPASPKPRRAAYILGLAVLVVVFVLGVGGIILLRMNSSGNPMTGPEATAIRETNDANMMMFDATRTVYAATRSAPFATEAPDGS